MHKYLVFQFYATKTTTTFGPQSLSLSYIPSCFSFSLNQIWKTSPIFVRYISNWAALFGCCGSFMPCFIYYFKLVWTVFKMVFHSSRLHLCLEFLRRNIIAFFKEVIIAALLVLHTPSSLQQNMNWAIFALCCKNWCFA